MIGYWTAPEFRRAGVVTKALSLISAWGVEHPGIHRLQLYVEPWNEGSGRAAERVGFVREGLMRRWKAVGDEPRDMFMYSLLPRRPAVDGPHLGRLRRSIAGSRSLARRSGRRGVR